MEIESMYTELRTEDGAVLRVVYKLLESRCREGAAYGLRCYVDGGNGSAEAREVFFDRAIAESAWRRMAAAGVMPVHIDDVLGELLY